MIVLVADQSAVAQARRMATAVARELGFDETDSGRVAIVATEMATNLLKHAQTGHIAIDKSFQGGVQLAAFDKGPGIADLARALQDGYSTAGSAGSGLGAIRRQADDFAVYSRGGKGTVLLARIDRSGVDRITGTTQIGALMDPYPGETECGDGWAAVELETGPIFMMIDGSGHGPAAALVAKTASAAFEGMRTADCVEAMEKLHRVLAPTRGGAAAVAFIDRSHRMVRFVGVGNISAAVVSEGQMRRMVSHNGILGHAAPRIREFTYPFGADVSLILHSDGLSTKWEVSDYPGIMTQHPGLLAAALMRDHRRSRDDASVAVAKVKV